MVKAVQLNTFLLLIAFAGSAQQDKGLLLGSLSIAPGHQLETNYSSYYLHGTSTYYLNQRVAFKGDFFYSLNTSENPELNFAHSLLFGISYHPFDSRFDPYIAYQAGITLGLVNFEGAEKDMHVLPTISPVIGMNYFFHRNMHFFTQVNLPKTPYVGSVNVGGDIRVAFGLGFQISDKLNQ